MNATSFSAAAPVSRRVRAYFAPVNRAAQAPVVFDPGEEGGFALDYAARAVDQPRLYSGLSRASR